MDKAKQNNLDLWQQFVDINSESEFYRLKEFKAGENSLHALEQEELGEVNGKSLLHLQCHFGMDTLSWARLGAQATGMDFSPKAIDLARSLSTELKLPAEFICCDLYDLPKHLNGQFDIVYTSYGVLTWLGDIPRWAQIAASYVKPGGVFYIAEFHPFASVFDSDQHGLVVRDPYFHKDPIGYWVDGSYADAHAKIAPIESFEWIHPLGEVVSSLIQEGLQIEFLHEFPYSFFQQLPDLVETEDHRFIFPDGKTPIPLIYSIRARKN